MTMVNSVLSCDWLGNCLHSLTMPLTHSHAEREEGGGGGVVLKVARNTVQYCTLLINKNMPSGVFSNSPFVPFLLVYSAARI